MAPPHFLTLPTEVREAVYLYLFGFYRGDLQIELYDFEYGMKRMAYFDYHPRSAQILRVCSQITSEAYPVFMQNTLVVAPRHSPLPLGFGRGFYRDSELLLHEPFRMKVHHLEYHASPSDLFHRKLGIIAKGHLLSLQSLRVISSAMVLTDTFEDDSHSKRMFKRWHGYIRNMMISYLSLSTIFTYLADESVDGRRICFHLYKGTKITKKVSMRHD